MATATTDVAPSVTPAGTAESFSFRQAREIIADLFDHRADLYWADLLVTLTIGYGAAAFYIHSHTFSLAVVACYFVAGFALFRAGSFIHEITHLHGGQMTRFTVGWNLLCGIPMLMPSFFYENHIDHHNTHRYGTIRDGEYLPLGAGSRWQLVWFWLQVPLLPAVFFFRLQNHHAALVQLPPVPTAVGSGAHVVVRDQFSPQARRPSNRTRRAWAWPEAACCLSAARWWPGPCQGSNPGRNAIKIYLLYADDVGLELRVEQRSWHHHRNTGGGRSYLEQLEDSVNITGHPLLTELFFPLGLSGITPGTICFPHCLTTSRARAYRQLMAQLPADSPYRQTVYPTYWSVLRELWNDPARTEKGAPKRLLKFQGQE